MILRIVAALFQKGESAFYEKLQQSLHLNNFMAYKCKPTTCLEVGRIPVTASATAKLLLHRLQWFKPAPHTPLKEELMMEIKCYSCLHPIN